MRRRLALLSLATTTLVVISFLVPLGLLVHRQAEDRARVNAERKAQSTASLLALAATLDPTEESIETIVGPLDDGVIVVLPDGSVLGEPQPGQGSLVDSALREQATITAVVDGGWEIALPVLGRDSAAVVDVFVSDQEMRRGVAGAWLLLGLLGGLMITAAALVADRLGQVLVKPIRDLAAAAHRMSQGDLQARVEPSDPPEVRELGETFNALAGRLDQLLIEERETVANLSHRLRTPLTSLRLQAEKIVDRDDRRQVISQVDRLEQSIDQVIVASRRGDVGVGHCRLNDVVGERAAFWRVLADEQDRRFDLSLGPGEVEVALSTDSVQAMVDALIGNVFAYTAAGTAFSVSTGVSGSQPWLQVADEGPGFPDRSLIERGASRVGSTGLGLDIARRTAEMAGGGIDIDDRPGGGAVVRVWLG